MTSPSGVGLPRSLGILIGLAAATVCIAGMRSISSLLAPTFLALVLVVAVHPLQRWLRGRHVPGWLATLAAVTVAYAIVLTLVLSLVLATARLATLLPTYEEEARALLDDAGSWLGSLGVHDAQESTLLTSLDPARLTGLVTSLLGGLLDVLSNLFFLGTLMLFLTADGSWFPQRLREARPLHGPLVEALESFAHLTRAYLVVSTIFGLIVASLDVLLLWALGVPAPLLWGLLAYITNYIPNVGFVIGLVPPAILALLEGGTGLMVTVIVAYCLINLVIQSIIQPKIVGDTVGLSTSLTFLSLAFWTWVLGPLGALLAVPASLLAKAVLIDVDAQNRWLRPLVSGDEALPEEPAGGATP